jgi:hypothetical protein
MQGSEQHIMFAPFFVLFNTKRLTHEIKVKLRIINFRVIHTVMNFNSGNKKMKINFISARKPKQPKSMQQ